MPSCPEPARMCDWKPSRAAGRASFAEADMLGTDFYVFLLAMILAIGLLFLMVWHVSLSLHHSFTCPTHHTADNAGRTEE